MRPRILIMAAIVAGTAALGSTAAAPASVGQAQAACKLTFAGPAWSLRAMSQQGNSWLIIKKGVTCKFANKWAKKLVKTPWRGEAGTVLKGPAGWSCLPRVGGELVTKGTPGECRKGSKLISWGPNLP